MMQVKGDMVMIGDEGEKGSGNRAVVTDEGKRLAQWEQGCSGLQA